MVNDKKQLERMMRWSDFLGKQGSFVGEFVNENVYDTITAEIFNLTNVLGNTYLRVLDRGVVYNTTSGQVAPLPDNIATCVYKDVSRNILYVGTTSAGVWEYNLTTKVGKVYNTTGGATSGQQLQSNTITSISKDETANILVVGTDSGIWLLYSGGGGSRITTLTAVLDDALPSDNIRTVQAVHFMTSFQIYVATASGVWVYTASANSGKLYNTAGGAGAGSQLPSNDVNSVFYDSVNSILYAATSLIVNGGIWVLSGGVGSIINNATVVVGDNLPSDDVYCIAKDISNNILYAGTSLGTWAYTIGTNTGKLFNTAGGAANGSQLPSNNNRSIFIDETNNILYVGTQMSGVWEYNVDTDTGKVYNTVSGASQGSQLPNNTVIHIEKDLTRNVLYVSTSAGLWQYAYLSNINYNGTQLRTVTYSEFVTSISTQPIIIYHLRLTCQTSNSQLWKPLMLYYNTPTGLVKSSFYSTIKNRLATDADQTVIDIYLDKPIVFTKDNYFKFDILPSTTVFFTVYYKQLDRSGLLSEIIKLRDPEEDFLK